MSAGSQIGAEHDGLEAAQIETALIPVLTAPERIAAMSRSRVGSRRT